MPKPRNKENKGLPKRWRFLHGAYYYRVPTGHEAAWDGKQSFQLGKTLPEAYRTWAERIKHIDDARTIGDLLERYALQVVPTKKITTQTNNAVALKRLRAVLGNVPLASLKPRHVYQYLDKRIAKVAARREVAVLSHAYTKAVEWGYLDRRPFKGEVRLKGEKPRDRYIEDWEIIECLSLPARRKSGSVRAIQAYIRIKLLTGLRRGDLLRITESSLKEDGIHVTPGKTKSSTGKQLIIEWSDELRAAVAAAKAARPVHVAPWLFCTGRGACYYNEKNGLARGWDGMWHNFMNKVLRVTKIKERFTEHDLRAKCASDAQTLEHARRLLAHADGKVTERIYRRKPERVRPLR